MAKATKTTAKKEVAAKQASTATAPKTAPKKAKTENVVMSEWRSIHVFGYGNTRLIGTNGTADASTASLKALAPFLASLAAIQQKGTNVALEEVHSLSIFNGAFADFRPGSGKNKPQRFAWADIDHKLVDKLQAEIMKESLASPKKKIVDTHSLMRQIRDRIEQRRKETEKTVTAAAKATAKKATKK